MRAIPILFIIALGCLAPLSVKADINEMAAKTTIMELPETMCATAVARQERLQNLPSHLLDAISLVESGRWSTERKASFAWPWTVTSGSNGNYFPTKEAAINEVHRLQSHGVHNIDVGCMQVNLMYHPDAFKTLDEAFDPAINTSYAATFLNQLYKNAGSWIQAAAYYHSMEPTESNIYRQKIVKTWDDAKRAALNAPPVTEAATSQSLLAPLIPQGMTPAMQAAEHEAQAARTRAAIAAAQRFANAWREARLVEYKLRKAQRLARIASVNAF
ncbi:MAG: transglycosylase SLT domain-containing protein [Alphaproteobacteria bacterium]|nr:transglycosylase SLT domain-containing protein [Alphaproteobacteria bacterium]